VASDVEAISALVMSYAERIDAGDLDGLAALFAHATWRSSVRAEPLRGAAEVRRAYDGVLLYDGVPGTRHMVTNLVVELEPPDRARARSTFTVFQARPDFPLQPVICGRYHDTFERVADVWRFSDRLIVPELIGDLSRHLRPGPALARG
jgi:3-phenylpropionate/cinnamic acid dioxygenase small subunit